MSFNRKMILAYLCVAGVLGIAALKPPLGPKADAAYPPPPQMVGIDHAVSWGPGLYAVYGTFIKPLGNQANPTITVGWQDETDGENAGSVTEVEFAPAGQANNYRKTYLNLWSNNAGANSAMGFGVFADWGNGANASASTAAGAVWTFSWDHYYGTGENNNAVGLFKRSDPVYQADKASCVWINFGTEKMALHMSGYIEPANYTQIRVQFWKLGGGPDGSGAYLIDETSGSLGINDYAWTWEKTLNRMRWDGATGPWIEEMYFRVGKRVAFTNGGPGDYVWSNNFIVGEVGKWATSY